MKITIITAVFNREATIAQAIESVRAQTWPHVEHLVIDGASTDGTLAAIDGARREAMRLVSEPDKGIYDALNKGVALASGDVVGLMHSDDFFAHDQVLAKVAAAFEAPSVLAVYGDLDYVSAADESRVVRRWRSGSYSPARLRRGWMPPHPALFLRRQVFERHGAYDTSYRIAADYDAVLRYFSRGNLNPAYIPDVLVKMRLGGESNRSLGNLVRKSREDYRALRANGVGGLYALAWKNLGKVGQFVGSDR
ncbi:glycosyltransferase family 2 protein [Aquibium sp. ELW1220]|uniref:glycosyltransferase family 2 protein n=1 Tax=Aquibium sp. ELW1220 TaxID=2976766 RepID=UPI0025AF574D|nr:glycosyltransferase family 2 protein [Aquibium sp. ELW1220]MDN2578980.1 glycosyltransferase [Aquibium sp. ELW1220]